MDLFLRQMPPTLYPSHPRFEWRSNRIMKIKRRGGDDSEGEWRWRR